MKATFFIMALLPLVTSNLHGQTRMVLYEEFTSETCPPSRPTDSVLWSLLNYGTNPDNVQFITFITPYPSAGSLYNSDVTDYSARTTYYSIPFVSNGRMDGRIPDSYSSGHPTYMTQTILDNEIAIPSPFNISVGAIYNLSGTVMDVNVRINCVSYYAPPGARMKLYTAFVRTLDYITPPGTNGQRHFENMVRKMYPSPGGIVIDSSWAPGDSVSIHLSCGVFSEAADSALHPHISSPGYLVVWMQNDNGHEIPQAARAMPVPLPLADQGYANSDHADNIDVYPNPAAGRVYVSYDMNSSEDVRISISDMVGHTVYAANEAPGLGKHTSVIPVKGLLPGIYTISIQRGEEKFQKYVTVSD